MSVCHTVLVLLVGACLGMLVGISIMLARLFARLSAMHEQLTELLEEAADNVRENDAEQHRHLDAAGTVVVEQMRQVGRALSLEIRDAACVPARAPPVTMGSRAAPYPGALRAPSITMGSRAAPYPGALRAPSTSSHGQGGGTCPRPLGKRRGHR